MATILTVTLRAITNGKVRTETFNVSVNYMANADDRAMEDARRRFPGIFKADNTTISLTHQSAPQ